MKKQLVSEYIYRCENQKTKAVFFQVEIRRTIDGEKFSFSESFAVKKWGTEKVALQQAKKRRNQKLDELDAGIITTADKALLNCSVNDLMDRLPALLGWTIETTQNKNRLYNKRIKPKYGTKKFRSIRAEDIQLNLNSMIDTASDNVIANVMTLWRQLYKAAIILRIVNYDVTIAVMKPVSNVVAVETNKEYSDEDFYRILNILSNPAHNLLPEEKYDHEVYHTVLITMYYLGCRPGEALAISLDSIDFKKHMIHIDDSVGSSTTEATVIKRTKRKKSIRWLPMHPNLEEILLHWISDKQIKDLLFLNYKGQLINTKLFSTTLSGIARYHGIDFSPYRLRHRFSSDLLQAQVDPRTVIELMGHASFRTSVDYARSNDSIKKKVVGERSSLKKDDFA